MEEMEAYSRKMILQRTLNKSTGLQETETEVRSSESQNNVRGTLALMKYYHCSIFGKHRSLK